MFQEKKSDSKLLDWPGGGPFWKNTIKKKKFSFEVFPHLLRLASLSAAWRGARDMGSGRPILLGRACWGLHTRTYVVRGSL